MVVSRHSTWPQIKEAGEVKNSSDDSSLDVSGAVIENKIDQHIRYNAVALFPDKNDEVDETDTGLAAWKSHLAKLSNAQRAMFLENGAGDLTQYISKVEDICQKLGDRSRATKVAKLVRPVFRTLNLYAPVAQTMIQADPTSSSLILGGITCIMSISSRFLDYQEKIVEMLSEMGIKAEILLQYGSEIYQNDATIVRAVVEVLGDILFFVSEAWNMFMHNDGRPRNSMKKFFTSLGQSFETRFGEITSKFYKDLDHFEDLARLTDRRETKAFRDLQFQFMKHQISTTNQHHSQVISMGNKVVTSTNQLQIERKQEIEVRTSEEVKQKSKQEIAERQQKRTKVLSWLPSIDFHNEQEQKDQKRLEATGTWLIENEIFQNWKALATSELLWVYGKRGCGKSFLASVVVGDLKRQTEAALDESKASGAPLHAAFAYIYCSSLNADQTDLPKLLGSILKQLSHFYPEPEIEPSLESLHDRHSELRKPDLAEIKDAILSILSQFSECFVVFDGLDECRIYEDDRFRDLCDFLRSLSKPRQDNSRVKVVVFSRPEYQPIKESFEGCPCIVIDDGANEKDIQQFISTKLASVKIKHLPDLQAEVEASLLSGAGGMFLWIDLVINSLKGLRRPSDVRRLLSDTSRNLDEVYATSLKRVCGQAKSVRSIALKAILIITNSKRPLHWTELLEVLAIEPGMDGLEAEDKLPSDDGLASECADLVVRDNNGVYHLLHSSLKDYLNQNPKSVPAEYSELQADANKIIGELCLTYLNFERFNNETSATLDKLLAFDDDNPFFSYATAYWGQHISGVDDDSMISLAQKFISSANRRNNCLQSQLYNQGENAVFPYRGPSTELHILSMVDLPNELVQLTAGMEPLKWCRDGLGGLPLDYSLLFKCRAMCNWLLEGSRPDTLQMNSRLRSGIPLIHLAATLNWGEVVAKLIRWSFDPNAIWGTLRSTALHMAATAGALETMQALMDSGQLDINAKQVDGSTALVAALLNGQNEAARWLITAGADINIVGWQNFTALHIAVRLGDLSLTQSLLQKGARLDESISDQWGRKSPLHLAVEAGFEEITRALLSSGAKVDITAKSANTPLHYAFSSRASGCIQLLLDFGADIGALTSDGGTIIHCAATKGHLDALQMLWKINPDQFVDLMQKSNRVSDLALHEALAAGHEQVAEFLLEKGSFTRTVGRFADTPLACAIRHEGSIRIVEKLLKQDQGAVSVPNVPGPIYDAARAGRKELLVSLREAGAGAQVSHETGWQPVHKAAEYDDLDFIIELRNQFPDLDLKSTTNDGCTPLFIAAGRGCLKVVNYLLEEDPQMYAIPADQDCLPLHAAARNGHPTVVKALLPFGKINAKTVFNETPLLLATTRGSLEAVTVLLDNGADIDIAADGGWTPLLSSIDAGCPKIAEILLQYGANPNLSNDAGRRALHLAADLGFTKLCRTLLEKCSNALCPSNNNVTPFHEAAGSFDDETIDIFLEKNIQGWDIPKHGGVLPFHQLALTGNVRKLKKLGKHFNEVVIGQKDDQGDTALAYGILNGDLEMLNALLSLGVPVESVNILGDTNLHHAARHGQYELLARMLALGASVDVRNALFGDTALHAAAWRQHTLSADILLKHGADPLCRNVFGYTPLDLVHKHPDLWLDTKIIDEPYIATRLSERQPYLFATISRTISELRLGSFSNTELELFERFEYLEIGSTELYQKWIKRLYGVQTLLTALNEMESTKMTEAVRLCLFELTSNSISACRKTCDVCRFTLDKTSTYFCRTCETDLCEDCHQDYLESTASPRSAPKFFEALYHFEEAMLWVRKVVRKYATYGAFLLISGFRLLKCTTEWMVAIEDCYEGWRDHYQGKPIKETEIGGKVFMDLMNNGINALEADVQRNAAVGQSQNLLAAAEQPKTHTSEPEPSGKDEKSLPNPMSPDEQESWSRWDADFFEHLCDFPPGAEQVYFTCSEHEYLEVPNEDKLNETQKKSLDDYGMLTNEYLLEVLNSPGVLELERASRDESPESVNENKHQIPDKVPINSDTAPEAGSKKLSQSAFSFDLRTRVSRTGHNVLEPIPEEDSQVDSATGQTNGTTSEKVAIIECETKQSGQNKVIRSVRGRMSPRNLASPSELKAIEYDHQVKIIFCCKRFESVLREIREAGRDSRQKRRQSSSRPHKPRSAKDVNRKRRGALNRPSKSQTDRKQRSDQPFEDDLRILFGTAHQILLLEVAWDFAQSCYYGSDSLSLLEEVQEDLSWSKQTKEAYEYCIGRARECGHERWILRTVHDELLTI